MTERYIYDFSFFFQAIQAPSSGARRQGQQTLSDNNGDSIRGSSEAPLLFTIGDDGCDVSLIMYYNNCRK